MLYQLYKKQWNSKLNLCLNINLFGLKIKNKNKKNINLILEEDFNNSYYNKFTNKEIFNLLVNLCMRKGHKKLAFKMIKNTFSLLRTFFWMESFFFIKLIIVKSEAVFTLQRYFLGKREKVIPRFINEKKKLRYVLRMLIKYAKTLQKEYKYFNISLVHAIMEYSKPSNVLSLLNKEENELAETNKFFLFKKNKKNKKVRLFRKINHWKKLIK